VEMNQVQSPYTAASVAINHHFCGDELLLLVDGIIYRDCVRQMQMKETTNHPMRSVRSSSSKVKIDRV